MKIRFIEITGQILEDDADQRKSMRRYLWQKIGIAKMFLGNLSKVIRMILY